jgi:shikimate dehydrogenase
MQKYAVIGYPLAHTLSPQIHNFAFKKLNIDAVYEKIEIHHDEFKEGIEKIKNGGYEGFNVTIPHKLNIALYIDQIDDDAKYAGAINTVVKRDKEWIGYNTDINGFLSPLTEYYYKLESCLVIGTGGAARAVVYSLIKYVKPKSIVIGGRRLSMAESLTKAFNMIPHSSQLGYISIEGLEAQLDRFNLIINTTPLGTYPNIDDSPLPTISNLSQGTIVYDLVYNPVKTKLLHDAELAGKDIQLINGMEMFIQQAASAFKIWTGHDMPVEEVKHYIDNNL